MCTFDHDLCGWTYDNNDWLHLWRLELALRSNTWGSSLCFRGRTSKSSSSLESSSSEVARLWSPVISAQKGGCLSLQYSVDIPDIPKAYREQPVTLAVLKRNLGSCTKRDHDLETKGAGVFCKSTTLWQMMKKRDVTVKQTAESVEQTQWNVAFIDLQQDENSDFKLILEGSIPAGMPNARICVDNITSYAEPCNVLLNQQTLTWKALFGLCFMGAVLLGLCIPVLMFCHRYLQRHRLNQKKLRYMSVDIESSGSSGTRSIFGGNNGHGANGHAVTNAPRMVMMRSTSTASGTNSTNSETSSNGATTASTQSQVQSTSGSSSGGSRTRRHRRQPAPPPNTSNGLNDSQQRPTSEENPLLSMTPMTELNSPRPNGSAMYHNDPPPPYSNSLARNAPVIMNFGNHNGVTSNSNNNHHNNIQIPPSTCGIRPPAYDELLLCSSTLFDAAGRPQTSFHGLPVAEV